MLLLQYTVFMFPFPKFCDCGKSDFLTLILMCWSLCAPQSFWIPYRREVFSRPDFPRLPIVSASLSEIVRPSSLLNDQQRALWERVCRRKKALVRIRKSQKGTSFWRPKPSFYRWANRCLGRRRDLPKVTQLQCGSQRWLLAPWHAPLCRGVAKHWMRQLSAGAIALSLPRFICQAPHFLKLSSSLLFHERKDLDFGGGTKHAVPLIPPWPLREHFTFLNNSYQLLGAVCIACMTRFNPQAKMVWGFNAFLSSMSPFWITPLIETSPHPFPLYGITYFI